MNIVFPHDKLKQKSFKLLLKSAIKAISNICCQKMNAKLG